MLPGREMLEFVRASEGWRVLGNGAMSPKNSLIRALRFKADMRTISDLWTVCNAIEISITSLAEEHQAETLYVVRQLIAQSLLMASCMMRLGSDGLDYVHVTLRALREFAADANTSRHRELADALNNAVHECEQMLITQKPPPK